MKNTVYSHFLNHAARVALAGAFVTVSFAALPALAHVDSDTPALVISNDPLPSSLQSKIYSKPNRAPETTAADLLGNDDTDAETSVGHKVDDLHHELLNLQGKVAKLSESLSGQEVTAQRYSADYYANIATINTQLQSGTTAGNPRLVRKLNVARDDLEKLSSNVSTMNGLAMDIANTASMASFMLQSAQAALNLSGAVEEDHVRLMRLEDEVNGTIVIIDRLLNNVNDDITRTAAYVGSERQNLRTLSLGVQTGDLFGKNLSNQPFANATPTVFAAPDTAVAPVMMTRATPPPAINDEDEVAPPPAPSVSMRTAPTPPPSLPPAPAPATYASAPVAANNSMAPMPPPAPVPASAPGLSPGSRPLVKIRFDRPDVAYEQPLYMAVNDVLSRYPDARFEVVAVHPGSGNPAEVAIESTRARRDAERVLRSLTQMGLSLDRIDLSYMPSLDATSDEVHVYVKQPGIGGR